MPSNINVYKENGDMLEVTLSTLFGWLADETSYRQVFAQLIKHGEATAELMDGPAVLRRIGAARQPAPPLSSFIADTRLTFEIPARIYCQAASPSEARNLVADVMHGSIRMPDGFSVEVDGDVVDQIFASLSIGNVAFVQDVEVTGVTQRLMLSGPRP